MSANPRLKNRTQFTNSLKNELYEKLQELSEKTMIPMSKLFDVAIKDLLKKYGKNPDEEG